MINVDLNIPWNPRKARSLVEASIEQGVLAVAFAVDIGTPELRGEPFARSCPVQDVALSDFSAATRERLRELSTSLKAAGPPKKSARPVRRAGPLEAFVHANSNFLQLRRATVTMDEAADVAAVNRFAREDHNFDIIALRPADDRSWIQAVENAEVDLISLDFSSGRLPFSIRRNQIGVAVGRGLFFEVVVEEIRRDRGRRQNFLANMRPLVRHLPRRRLVFSSGARSTVDVCNPVDVANLASVLGFGGVSDCVAVMRENALALLYKGASRSTVSAMVGPGAGFPFSDAWGAARQKRPRDEEGPGGPPRKARREAGNPLLEG
eukprot:Polyplicarium_translucidae@DN2902_c0_g1_i1.p2